MPTMLLSFFSTLLRCTAVLTVFALAATLRAATDQPPAPDRPEPFHLAKGQMAWCWSAGVAIGTTQYGGVKSRDLGLGTFTFSYVLTNPMAAGTRWEGSWVKFVELIGAGQFQPGSGYLVAVVPGFRYEFRGGDRWRPFVEVGSGPSITDLGRPDLGGKIQFYSSFGGGAHILLQDRTALTLRYRFSHVSNAGLDRPNHGINNHTVLAGLTVYF